MLTLVPPCPLASGPLQRDLRSAARQDPGYLYSKFLCASLVIDRLARSRSRGGKRLQRVFAHLCADKGAGRILGPDFSADGKTLYTPSLDGTILQYDLAGGRRFGSPFRLGVPSKRLFSR